MNSHSLNKKVERVYNEMRDYLTFYHELRIPRNHYFDLGINQNDKNKLLMIASPSRMGNHLLLSMLDNHPDLPRVPGEDGFLYFSFLHANKDVYSFINKIRGDNSLEYITRLGSNCGRNKWKEFKRCFKNNIDSNERAGVNVKEYPSIIDYEGTVFDINYDDFIKSLTNNIKIIRNSDNYNVVFQKYLDALKLLDYEYEEKVFDSFIVFGGMRTQTKWICETYKHVKILCSLRSFDTYSISQIKSKHGNIEISEKLIQEAWEHWYHKVIDRIFLKLQYPSKIGIVLFEDLIKDSKDYREKMCHFLGIDYHSNLSEPTIFGNPVKGNSWNSRAEYAKGKYYRPEYFLDPNYIPDDHEKIWKIVNIISL